MIDEKQLEKLLVKNTSILDPNWLIIGEQVFTEEIKILICSANCGRII